MNRFFLISMWRFGLLARGGKWLKQERRIVLNRLNGNGK
jgi:hypothetical protein